MKSKLKRRLRQLEELKAKHASQQRPPEPAVVKKPDGMYMQVIDVTPDIAAAWIEKNYVSNRDLRWALVTKYADSMKAGTWQESAQGLIFDTAGNLLDGQHRLYAIWEAQVTVRMTVVFNAPTESFGVLDQGKNRSVSDLSEDEFVTQKIVAIARSMARGPVQSHFGHFDDRDPTLLLAFIDEVRPTLEGVLRLLPSEKRARGKSLLSATIMGAICRAYAHESHAALERFIQVFTSGVTESDNERIIIVLRDFAKENPTERNTIYQKAQRAIKAYCENDPIRSLLAAADDLYPLPGKDARRSASTDATRAREHHKSQRTKR